jgi:hypothetical protein
VSGTDISREAREGRQAQKQGRDRYDETNCAQAAGATRPWGKAAAWKTTILSLAEVSHS